MTYSYIWGLSGIVREGETISFISDTLPDGNGIEFKINSIRKREDGKTELQGFAFFGKATERSAILVLDKDDYDAFETRCGFDSVGVLTLQP